MPRSAAPSEGGGADTVCGPLPGSGRLYSATSSTGNDVCLWAKDFTPACGTDQPYGDRSGACAAAIDESVARLTAAYTSVLGWIAALKLNSSLKREALPVGAREMWASPLADSDKDDWGQLGLRHSDIAKAQLGFPEDQDQARVNPCARAAPATQTLPTRATGAPR